MNVFRPLSPRPLAALGLLGLLGGCSSLPGGDPFAVAPIDPTSPAAAQVQTALATDAPFPKFIDIPPLPTDVRSADQWAQSTGAIEQAGENLAQATAPSTWSLDATDRFAAQAQARSHEGPAAPGEADRKATEAFARDLQKRATPPPLKR